MGRRKNAPPTLRRIPILSSSQSTTRSDQQPPQVDIVARILHSHRRQKLLDSNAGESIVVSSSPPRQSHALASLDAANVVVLAGSLPSQFVAMERHQRAGAVRPNTTIRYSGPAPPASWSGRKVNLSVAQTQHGFADPDLTFDVKLGCVPSLYNISALVVARNIEQLSQQVLSALSSTTKETMMAARSRLVAQGLAPALRPAHMSPFMDAQMRYLDLSHSDVDLTTLASLLPAQPSTGNPWNKGIDIADTDDAPDSWEDLADDPATSGIQTTRTTSSRLSPSPLHSLSIAYTLASLHTRKIPVLITSRIPLLSYLNISGCFTALDGPPALTVFDRGLPCLERLDVSHCLWIGQWDGWNRAFGLLGVLACRGAETDAWVKGIRKLRPRWSVIS